MDLATRQALLAGTRDVAVQRLRDMTLAIGVGAAGAVGLAAYIAAATIPGVSDASASEQASAQAGTADIPSQVTAPSGTSTDPSTTQPAPVVSPAPRHHKSVAVSGGSR